MDDDDYENAALDLLERAKNVIFRKWIRDGIETDKQLVDDIQRFIEDVTHWSAGK